MAKKVFKKSAKKRLRATSRSRSKQSQHKGLAIKPDELPTESDPSPRLVWVDTMTYAVRADIPIITLRFYSVVLEKLCEACRLQTSVEHLRRMLDGLCKATDYYPSRPRKS